MKKTLGKITQITRPYKSGMYTDTYTVLYQNGDYREYKIKGAMINKHFDFIMNAKCEPIYNNKNGRHVGDRFIVF